jgi:hypothetical protein
MSVAITARSVREPERAVLNSDMAANREIGRWLVILGIGRFRVNAGVGGRDACGKPARCARYVKLRSYAVLSRENCIGVLGIISRYELRHDKREIILQLYRAFEG